MEDKKYFTIIVGEEVGSKARCFLIAPNFTSVVVGDIVLAHGLKFRAVYVDEYCIEDGMEMTLLRVALGEPFQAKAIIKEEPITWEDSDDDVDG